jgi:hypothetical protein
MDFCAAFDKVPDITVFARKFKINWAVDTIKLNLR